MEHTIKSSEVVHYQCLILHPSRPLGFFGTTKGCVEIWHLERKEILAEVRYLVVDQFGEQIPVEEPVVHLDAPEDFEFVYAFMGNAAYCIDVELLTIVQQIPISEKVVAGSISENTGEIATVTSTGYLSQWSPRFVQRLASLELEFDTTLCYMCHDTDENRVILVFDKGDLVVVNFKEEPYFVRLHYPGTGDLLGSIFYDKSHHFQCIINPNGWISLFPTNATNLIIPPDHFLSEGKIIADQKLRDFVSSSDLFEEDRVYIKDYRLQRLSIERYLVEINSLSQSDHSQKSIEEDAKTLEYALAEYDSDSIQQKSRSLALIEKIAERNDLSTRYLLFAHRKADQIQSHLNIIEKARSMEFTAFRRQKQVNWVMITATGVILTLVVLASLLEFSIVPHIILSIFVVLGLLLLYYWNGINSPFEIPGVKKYRGIQAFLLFVILSSVVYYIGNHILSQLNFLLP